MTATIDWARSAHPVAYLDAVSAMEQRVAAIVAGKANELVWLLEHPALYTAGTSARPSDLLCPDALPVFKTGRGGQYTYHGPGQRIAYVMLDLGRREPDVRLFVDQLQKWIVAAVAALGIDAGPREGRVGIWVERPGGPGGVDDKLAAIGIRLRKWVSFHGISLNVNPDLSHYGGIVPCGVSDHGVTSLAALGVDATLPEVDANLRAQFEKFFGPTNDAAAPRFDGPMQTSAAPIGT